MTDQQIYNLRWKFPELLFSFIKYGRKVELLDSMSIDSSRLLSFLASEDFPTEDELKDFCEYFKMMYSTLKTWNVMHLVENSK